MPRPKNALSIEDVGNPYNPLSAADVWRMNRDALANAYANAGAYTDTLQQPRDPTREYAAVYPGSRPAGSNEDWSFDLKGGITGQLLGGPRAAHDLIHTGTFDPADAGGAVQALAVPDMMLRPSANALMSAGGIRAFHGTPHNFDRFDLGKIGTGEGAQAYGHGLYFAEHEPVAMSYRDALTRADPGPWNAQLSDLRERMTDLNHTIMTAPRGSDAAQRAWAELNLVSDQHAALLENPPQPAPGHMYEVGINADPEHFLHWDKPLSEQSQHVQEALAKLNVKLPDYSVRAVEGGHAVDYPGVQSSRVFKTEADAHNAASATRTMMGHDPSGAQILNDVHHAQYGPDGPIGQVARPEELLQSAGIPGIKYLDGGSRDSGEGTHNYVVFNPETINILRKYGLAGLMGGGAAAAGSQQGDQ